MNESFSDLGSVGALETNEDPMPYVHKLMQVRRTPSAVS